MDDYTFHRTYDISFEDLITISTDGYSIIKCSGSELDRICFFSCKTLKFQIFSGKFSGGVFGVPSQIIIKTVPNYQMTHPLHVCPIFLAI